MGAGGGGISVKSQCTCVVTGIYEAAATYSFPQIGLPKCMPFFFLFNTIILIQKSVNVFEASLWSLYGGRENEQLRGKTAAMQVGENAKLLICNADIK